MRLLLKDSLPFVTLSVTHKGKTVDILDVLIDTGSGSTILSSDIVQTIGIVPSPEDILFAIRGVGGSEVVFSRRVDAIQLAECNLSNFQVEIGGMDYGFEINGIIGMDFLIQAGAIINLLDMTISFNNKK
jgi:predicted aspartyl protease